MMRSLARIALLVVALLAAAAAIVGWLNVRGEAPVAADAKPPAPAGDATVARGAYLARAGNCIGCHTARGGADYAGGRPIHTPFGIVYASNLTPDPQTGLGDWSADAFWRAMHNGRSKDGRLLYPAFPYPNFTLVTRADSDAILAFLRTLPPVRAPNREHALRFPYNLQPALAAWRALYFRPERFEPDPARSAQWNRGSYLVRGLGHCDACHSPRNWLGATQDSAAFGGAPLPMQPWHAPSLASGAEAAVADWPIDDVVSLLKTGISARGSTLGPMAEVVFRSTQYLERDDLRAIAVFLQALPPAPAAPTPRAPAPKAGDALLRQGAAIYAEHCAECHGEHGEGVASIYPPIAGNRSVTLATPINLVNVILRGGFPPATAGNPRPFGMPPFAHSLTNEEIAAVATYVRQSWGHAASPVTPVEVFRLR